jgi:DNA polymerase I-like protein with 3'-5' exonuclease and polymerase domains
MGCSIEEATNFANAYINGFNGIAEFKKKGSKFVRTHGYIVLNPITGHKTYWWDWDKWIEEQKSFTQEFWNDYRINHKGTNDEVCKKVAHHARVGSKWDRKALNSVTQGTGAICLKVAGKKLFDYIINNGYFDKVKIVNFVHDEICVEYPKNLGIAKILEDIMEETTRIFCKSLPIPAEASEGSHWIH